MIKNYILLFLFSISSLLLIAQKNQIDSLENICLEQHHNGKFGDLFISLAQLKSIYEKQNDTSKIVHTILKMADASRAGGNHVGALSILLELEESGLHLTTHQQIGVYLIKGSVYYELSNHQNSILLAKKGLRICPAESEKAYKSLLHNLLGASYISTDADSAIKYIQISINEFLENGDSSGVVLPIINLARLNMEKGNDKKAIELIENSLVVLDKNDVPIYRKMAYDYLSMLNYNLHNYKESVIYFKLRDSVNYEIRNNAISFQIAEYQNKLSRQKNANDVLALEAQIEIGHVKSNRDNTIILLGITLLVLLGLFLFYTVKTNRTEKSLNADLIKKTIELEGLVEFKAKILSVISHDMRTPFAQLITFQEAKTVGLEFTEQETLEIDQNILASTKNGLIVLDNLLKWANSQFGGLEVNLRTFNSQESISQIVDQVTLSAKGKSIEIKSDLASVEIKSDEAFFQIILRNLLNNAVKFSPTKSEVIVRSSHKGSQLEIEIIDSGLGISDNVIELLKHAREVQPQLGSEGEKGTGVGLYFSIDFAKKMGGSISFKRGKTHGTIVTFTIPVKAV